MSVTVERVEGFLRERENVKKIAGSKWSKPIYNTQSFDEHTVRKVGVVLFNKIFLNELDIFSRYMNKQLMIYGRFILKNLA